MARMFRNLGAGLLRGATADVLGMPIDTLNMIRQGLLAPAEGGNPMARSLTGLLGPVQQTGSSDYFAQQMGLPQGEGPAYEIARMVSPSPADIMSAVRRAPTMQELITYHGTPHRFEPTPENPLGEFRASQIGTGEGAQVYGHGIYLAESPDVAKSYASMDSPFAAAGLKGPAATVAALAKIDGKGNPVKFLQDNYDAQVKQFGKQEVDSAIAGLKRGNLYTADLPDEMVDRMLDWDKPLSEQPDNVKKALEPLVREALKKQGTPEGYLDYHTQRKKGGDIRELLRFNIGDRAFSEKMKELGIPGIKYFDASSRDVKEGTRNFVVFPSEEKKVKILKRE